MSNTFAFSRAGVRTEEERTTEWRQEKEEKEEKDAWWHQVTQKCHEGGEQRLRKRGTEKESRHPIAKAALNIVSSPEGCDIFLQSLLAVLISLHMSWMKIEFVWKRGRYYWLYHRLLIVCVSLCLRACLWMSVRLFLCICVRVRVCKHCPHQSQPIHNSNGLCFSHTSLSMHLTSAVPAYLMAET